MSETRLPLPDAIIGGVGTQICFPSEVARLDDWPIASAGQWEPDVVRQIAAKYHELEPQLEHLHDRHKGQFLRPRSGRTVPH